MARRVAGRVVDVERADPFAVVDALDPEVRHLDERARQPLDQTLAVERRRRAPLNVAGVRVGGVDGRVQPAARQRRQSPDVVDVVVRQEHPLDVRQRGASPLDPAFDRAGVQRRSGVDERRSLAVPGDEVGVHPEATNPVDAGR